MTIKPKTTSPAAAAAFEASGLRPRTVEQYTTPWNRWETWCTSNGVNFLDATHHDYRRFAEETPNWNKRQAESTSSALASVYRHNGKDNPAQPVPKFTPSPAAAAAFEAAGLSRNTIKTYRPLWNRWETWCTSNGVDPLAATNYEYQRFVADTPIWNKVKAKQTSSALDCVYKHIGKNNPTRPAIKVTPWHSAAIAALEAAGLSRYSLKNYKTAWNRWETWCINNDVDPLSAANHHYRRFEADTPNWNKSKASPTSCALACVYRHIGKDSPAQSAAKTVAKATTSPVAAAAFAAAGLTSNTVRGYRPRWNRWETWCINNDVDPLAGTNHDYRRFLADTPNWKKFSAKQTSVALACVYKHIGKTNPAQPAVKVTRSRSSGMRTKPKPVSPAAAAAFEAASLSPNSVKMYTTAWNRWETWCISNRVDPLAATHYHYRRFAEETPDWNRSKAKHTSATLACVYRHSGKNNPARPAIKVNLERADKHQLWLARFRLWCEDRGKICLPAEPEDVAAFLKEIAQSHPKYQTQDARASIAWYHKLLGYRAPSSYPEVHAQTANIEDKYPKTVNRPKYIRESEAQRERWRTWCNGQGIDALEATPAHICQYINLLVSQGLARRTIIKYIRSLNVLYGKPSPTTAPNVRATIAAIPHTNPTLRQPTEARKEVEADIQHILELSMLEQTPPPGLTPEQITRVSQAVVDGDVTRTTFVHYVRYGWLPFKRWCQTIGIQIETADPAHVATYLCELSDNKSSGEAASARIALTYCYKLTRPLDNPASHLSVSAVTRGLNRTNPHAPSQVDPITDEEFQIIRAAAHNPRGSERPHQTRLRGNTDIALIGTMRDAMLRKQEASDALWRHLEELPDGGATLFIPRSKTDQTGEGATVYLSPQTMNDLGAMQQSMRETGIEISEDGKIFRMSRDMVYQHIKTACYAAGLPGRFAGHSPRIGMTQDLTYANTSNLGIQEAGRWKNGAMPAYYGRKMKASKNAVAKWHSRKRRKGRPDRVMDPDPLSSYGITLPYTGARPGH